jgi:hypothetical protein
MNQSQVSANAIPLRAGSDVSLSADKRMATWHRTALLLAAWVEIIVGASFVLAFKGQSQLVFGATVEGTGALFARLAGIGLIGLGLACLPSSVAGTQRVAVRGLFIFNVLATILFAWIGVATTFRGVVLWPVVILHAFLAIVLALVLRTTPHVT